MGLDPQPGMTVRLPCRGCGSFVSTKLVRGKASVACAKCARRLEVELYPDGPAWRVRTRFAPFER